MDLSIALWASKLAVDFFIDCGKDYCKNYIISKVPQLKDKAKYTNLTTIQLNHDLDKAVHLAEWISTLFFAEQMEKHLREKGDVNVHIFIRIKNVAKDKISNFETINPENSIGIDDIITMAIKDSVSIKKYLPNESIGLREKTIENHIKKLKIRIPEGYKTTEEYNIFIEAIKVKWKPNKVGVQFGEVDWFELTCLFFTEILKLDDNIKTAFNTQVLLQTYIETSSTRKTAEEILSHITEKKIVDKPSLITNINKPDFLDNHSFFFKTKNNNISSITKRLKSPEKRLCLWGFPGVGKSFIAKNIAYTHFKNNKNKYEIIWWIDAEKIEDELLELAQNIFETNAVKIWIEEDKIGEMGVINKLKEKLKELSWFIIFDNAKDTGSVTELEEFHRKYFPIIKSDSLLLVTSLNKKWGKINPDIPIYPIGKWDIEDIENFMRFTPKGREESWHQLQIENGNNLKIFDGLPLAASIAKTYMIAKGDRSFSNFFKGWESLKKEIREGKSLAGAYRKKDENLLTTVLLSYNSLSILEKNLINLLTCFGPDDTPIKLLFDENRLFFTENLKIDSWDEIRNNLINIADLSLINFDEHSIPLVSIHRLIQDCIQNIQDKSTSLNNLRLVLLMLNNAFNNHKSLLLSHVDFIATTLTNVANYKISLLELMNKEEYEQTVKLFIETGKHHFELGDIKSAENQYRVALSLVKDKSIEADIKKSLSNILFLKGKEGLEESIIFIDEAIIYYNSLSQDEGLEYLISCNNDVKNKIFQRQCLFEECENILNNIKKAVLDYNDSISGDLYQYIVEQYISDKKSSQIADKLSGIYHNLGSLYWTWGKLGSNPYQTSSNYFEKAIDFQQNLINSIDLKIDELKELTDFSTDNLVDNKLKGQIKKLEGIKNNKILYLNVSRMIYGAVLGLRRDFIKQKEMHMLAFEDFEMRAKEKRRYTYTAYYILCYGWDREALQEGKFDDADIFIKHVYKYKEILMGTDEKYDLIEKIVCLRKAIRDDKEDIATEAHEQLWQQLKKMKPSDNRYYDVDTCSVSAFLDYAQFLKEKDRGKARRVIKQALAITKDIEYHRMEDLNQLAKDLGIF